MHLWIYLPPSCLDMHGEYILTVQTMIVHLSAVSDEVLRTSPAYSYILKQSQAFGVAMVLNLGLLMKGCQAEVPLTMTNAVKTGNFRANSQLAFHAFSIFNLQFTEASNMTNYNKIELDLLLTKGDSVPKDVAKKLSENKAKCPENSHHPPVQQLVWDAPDLLWEECVDYKRSLSLDRSYRSIRIVI
jgi:hypothetical protein